MKTKEFNQKEYIKQYHKDNYKMFAFRIKKTDKQLINKLQKIKNKNEYIVDLINNDFNTNKNNGILSLKELKLIIKPILNEKGIYDIYLFGSYARGEANKNSDVDIYCEHGNIKNLYDVYDLNEDLKNALNKNVDIIFKDSILEKEFEKNLEKDLIKLC